MNSKIIIRNEKDADAGAINDKGPSPSMKDSRRTALYRVPDPARCG